MSQRVGIFAGSFDPVHTGHISFALQAAKEANLDKVYFLPEIKPRRKESVTHISHRIAMINLACKPHNQLVILELPDKQFSVAKTMPRLKQHFPEAELFLLVGADYELTHLADWPLAEQLLEQFGLIAALRGKARKDVESFIKTLPKPPNGLYIINSPGAGISSRDIRTAVASGKKIDGLLPSVKNYINANWLYSAVAAVSNNSE